MMTTTLRIALILVSLGTFAMIMRKIRQSRMQIESAIFWIVLALVLVVYSVFPKVADACAGLLGIYATTNFLFLSKLTVLMAGGLGILYLFGLPPLSAPDEISHYVSAYRLSSQMTGQPQRDRYGRVLLRAQDAWVEDLDGDFVYEPDEDGNLQVTAKSREQAVKLGETMEEST